MRAFRGWIAIVGCVAALVGCGDDDGATETDAGSTPDGGPVDPCSGRTLCETAGATCDGETLVTCGADADGCMIAIRTECAASGGVCRTFAGAAACFDPCELVPEDDRCEVEGARSCEGDVLSICSRDEHGCLVRADTDCAATPFGRCEETGEMPICVMGSDPCVSVPAERRCEAAGASCSDDSLVRCEPDAFGCLVTSTTDCSSVAGGTCGASGGAAQCTAPNACAGVTQCAAPGTRCDGPNLVTCAPNGFGCLVETTADCTDTMFGFCDEDATPRAQCSTAASDPCMGVEECGTRRSRTCADRGTLRVCQLNAFGCYVAEDTDCRATSQVCDPNGGSAVCLDPCLFVESCNGPRECDGADIVTCTPNADGCLVESSRVTCEGATRCVLQDGEAICGDGICPEAQTQILGCDTGTITGTTLGGTTARSGYSCTPSVAYPGPERIYRFQNTGESRVAVTIVAESAATSTGDFDLFAWDGNDGTVPCTASSITCLDWGNANTPTETIEFFAAPGDSAYVAYDIYSTQDTADYTLTVTCRPIVCGDGLVATGEPCDDGNTMAGDGCSATCGIEAGYACSGEPSTCVFRCGNGVLDASETCDDGNDDGGDGCSSACAVEPGYVCGPAPSVCEAIICGNGAIEYTEGCDDGGTTAGDGCSGDCAREIAAPGGSIALSGALEAADPDWSRPSEGCGAGNPSPYNHDAFTIVNATGSPRMLRVEAAWLQVGGGAQNQDGFLHVYRAPFSAAAPTTNCLAGDDDENGVSGSLVPSVAIAPGERLVIVPSTYYQNATIGGYAITVTTQ